ncbi:MAG: 30S ribosomal protein S6 [Candidatus Paceibacterota bacterium]
MTENTMPAVEAENVELDGADLHSYELAFHILPTVAEGEVSQVFESIKDLIKKEKGEIFDEEAPERFELAYEIFKNIESKNRKFKSAYFGWVRFKALPADAAALNSEVGGDNSILRHLLVKLTKVEEENPFRFHDALREQKVVQNFDESDVIADSKEVAPADEEEVVEETSKEDVPNKEDNV